MCWKPRCIAHCTCKFFHLIFSHFSLWEDKSFHLHLRFFKHEICQLHDKSKIHADVFYSGSFSKVAKNSFIMVVFPKKCFFGKTWGFLKKKIKFEILSAVLVQFCPFFRKFFFQVTAFQRFFPNLEGGKNLGVRRASCFRIFEFLLGSYFLPNERAKFNNFFSETFVLPFLIKIFVAVL